MFQMAPAAVIPQYANANNKSAAAPQSEWNNMDSALDFDLLAEYLLEDVGAGGFDFSNPNPEAVSPPTTIAKTQQPSVSVQLLPQAQDPGVVTPNGSVAAQIQQPHVAAQAPPQQQQQQMLPTSGDLSGELSQVQQMIAQQSNGVAAPAPIAPVPPQPLHQQPQMRPVVQQVAPSNTIMAVQPPQPPPKPQPPAMAVAAAPITQHRPAMAVPMQQPNKRPRINAPPPRAKVPSFSFASVSGASAAHAAAMASASAPGGRQKSQAQLDRRRERNRILARRTRLRKKFFFESLQKDVADLQRENAALKSIVRSRLKPDDARVLLKRCDANEKLPSAIHAQEGDYGFGGPGMGGAPPGSDAGVKKLDKEDFSLIQSIQNSQQCFIITDPSLHDNPIVYASDDFLTLTGYSQEEVLGRNCRFLQGTETCQEKVAQIRKSVSVGEDVNVTFVNYTSDGKPFWNSLFIAALRDADNNIVNFIGVIVKVAGPERGDSEYGKVLN